MGKRIVLAGFAILLFGVGMYGSAHIMDVQRERGDVNGDGAINVLDAVQTIHIVLGTSPPPSGEELWAADCNGDGEANVLDALGIVNVILGIGTCVSSCDEVDCDDGNPCTEDSCDSLLVQCRHETLKNGTPCDDGDPRTENDMCVDGTCGGSPRDLAEELQKTLDNALADCYHGIGASAAVLIPDRELWLGVSGVSHDTISITPDMIFAIASITKTFTATLVLQLEEEEVLSVDDCLHAWLPVYPHIDSTITIRQLLNHSSGIFNCLDHPSRGDLFYDNDDRIWTPEEVITTLVDEPYFAPGTSYRYSNTNYILLGMIIKEATGSEISTLLRNRILDPLGLCHTFLGVEEEIIGELAHGWEDYNNDGVFEDLSIYSRDPVDSIIWTCGAMYSTAEDLVLFFRGLFQGDLLTQSSLDYEYGFTAVPDIIPDIRPGVRGIGQDGGVNGYSARVQYLPDYDVYMSILVNNFSYDCKATISDALTEVVVNHLDP